MDANEQAWALVDALASSYLAGQPQSARVGMLADELRAAYERGVADERERCAKIAERTDIGCDEFGSRLACHRTIAAAIREGGTDAR